MPSNWTDAQLSKWAYDYEKTLCAKYDLIVDRYSPDITAGISDYELPNYVTNIRMVLYLGKCIYPKGAASSVMIGDTPFQTSKSPPYEYMFGSKGMRVIKFFPSPDLTIAAVGGDLFQISADAAGVIIEFYRTPSQTDATRKLPTWIRRQLLKDNISYKAATSEGPNQDLKMSQYYQSKLDSHEVILDGMRENLNSICVNILSDRPRRSQRKPGHPVLPPNFGYPSNA